MQTCGEDRSTRCIIIELENIQAEVKTFIVTDGFPVGHVITLELESQAGVRTDVKVII